MEIRQLRYFIAVADTLNFSRAADSVYLSQSALSRQIMELEREVGLPLLRRSTRQVELTPAGKALQTAAKDFISRWEKLLPEVRESAATTLETQSLTIGTDARALESPVYHRWFLSTLYDLRQKFPGVRILLRKCDYQELLQGISDRYLDCALVLDREIESRRDICQESYDSEEMLLVFRSANAHADGDHEDIIMNRGLVLVDKEPQGLYHIIHILSDLRLEPQIRFCESLDDMTMTIETGESAAILPASIVEKLNNPNLQALHLPTAHAKLTRMLLWKKDQENPLLSELRNRMKARKSKLEQL